MQRSKDFKFFVLTSLLLTTYHLILTIYYLQLNINKKTLKPQFKDLEHAFYRVPIVDLLALKS